MMTQSPDLNVQTSQLDRLPTELPGVAPESFKSVEGLQYHGNPLRLVLDTDGTPMQTSSSQHYSVPWAFELSKPLLMIVVSEMFFCVQQHHFHRR